MPGNGLRALYLLSHRILTKTLGINITLFYKTGVFLAPFFPFSLTFLWLLIFVLGPSHGNPFTLHWLEVFSLSTYCPCFVSQEPRTDWQRQKYPERVEEEEKLKRQRRILFSGRQRGKTINIILSMIPCHISHTVGIQQMFLKLNLSSGKLVRAWNSLGLLCLHSKRCQGNYSRAINLYLHALVFTE